jgi:diguanylate cyclase (GGDEF)-like protein/PAS domain S-box-containing protein
MRSRRGLTAAAILGLLASTVAIAATVAHDQDRRAREEQENEAARAAGDLSSQLRLTLGGLTGVRGLFASSRRVTGEEFKTFSRGLLGDSPLSGTMLAQRIEPGRRAAFARAHGSRIRPPAGRPAARVTETAFAVAAELWRSGFDAGTGIDLGADPSWRAALRAALADGAPRATPPTPLLGSGRTGLMVFQPIYQRGAAMDTAAQRRAATAAFAVGAFDARALGTGVLDRRRPGTRLRIFDGGTLIFGPRGRLETPVLEHVDAAGRNLQLQVSVPADGSTALPATILGGGLVLSGLMALMLLTHERREHYAQALSDRRLAEREEAQTALRESVQAEVMTSERSAEALRRSEQRYRTLANSLPQTSVVTYDRDLRFTLAAGPALKEAGVESREVEGRGLADVVDGSELAMLEPLYRAPLRGESRSIEYTDDSGRSFWLRTLPLRDAGGAVTGGLAVSLDVTDRVRAERGQREAEERFRRAFEDSGVGMATAAAEGDSLIDVNDALCELTGYPRDVLLQTGLMALTHPDDVPAAQAATQRLLSGEEDSVQNEQRLMTREGRPVWVLAATSLVRDETGEPILRIVQLQDVTEHKRFERELQHLADHDPLTGLLNRRRFEEELQRELATAMRYGRGGAVIALDLDHFKHVNDSLGHSAGDALITRVGGLLEERLRESDIVARLSGDEFAVVLPQADERRALAVADELLETIRTGAILTQGPVPTGTTASVGVSLFGDDPHDVTGEELMAEADLAMYEAKEAGRDRRSIYKATDRRARIEARRTWVDRIKRALADDRFELEGQRIISLIGDDRPRYELLLRMVGEDGDLIPPGAFLDAAERFELIAEIDRWVLSRAVELLARFESVGVKAALEVNVSSASVLEPSLPEVIAAELQRSGADPSGLILEMTETAAVVNVERSRRFAEAVRELGCEFALDDFGAGFASFYFLKHLSFDYIKIDGEYIHNLPEDHTNQLLVRALVDIAHGLGRRTIAEFVGDEATLKLLRSLGVDYVQGFHIARPGPIEVSRLESRQPAAQ